MRPHRQRYTRPQDDGKGTFFMLLFILAAAVTFAVCWISAGEKEDVRRAEEIYQRATRDNLGYSR